MNQVWDCPPSKGWQNHSIVIQTILNSAAAGLSFQPKYIACVSGLPENICQSHCELLAKAGQIRRVLKDFEVWFKENEK